MSSRNHPLHNKSIKISVEYEFSTNDENIDEELIQNLLDNEPVPHVLTLLTTGTGLEWKKFRNVKDIQINDLD